MSEELDLNKVAAEFVTHNLEKFYENGKGVLKGAADQVRLRLKKSYSDYLSCIAQRYSKAKSFFIRNEPTNIYDFYVPLGISSSKGNIEAASSADISRINTFCVITGGGGSGKSMLMRHLLLDTIIRQEKVPIFIELREVTESSQDIMALIQSTLASNNFKLDSDYITKAVNAGHFAFFFDGFDEITRSLRKKISKQIQQLAKSYDQNMFVISSRPDDEFMGWTNFSVFSIEALTLTKAAELVEKLPFDADLKSKFLKDLKEGLFEKHKSFLSNPLLLSIMLLTYGESADIPSKLNIFYNQAYEALFQRHDALKGGFQRDRSTSLDIQDFAKVFSAFSVQTYDKRIFQFSRSDAAQYLEKSKIILNLEFSPEEYLNDALQSVCLLTEEGLHIVFSHRSFQEYFVARFINNSIPELQRKLVSKYSKNLGVDTVMKLLYEMNPDLVERILIIPGIEKLQQTLGIKRRAGITHFLRFLKTQFYLIRIETDRVSADVGPTDYFLAQLIMFALESCGDLIGWKGFDIVTWKGEEQNLIRKYSAREKPFRLRTSGLTIRHELVRDLSTSNTFFSINTLNSMLDLKKALVDKHQRSDRSLEELLKD